MRIDVGAGKSAGVYSFQFAKITDVNYDEDTAGAYLLDDNDNPLPGPLFNLPIFYHCNPDAVLRDNGALEGAASAFETGDIVYIGYESPESLNLKIMGRVDGLKACYTRLFMVFVSGVTDAYDADSQAVYTVYAWKIDKALALSPLDGGAVTVESHNGSTSLAIQSSPVGKRHYFLAPHQFSFQQFIDFLTPDATFNYVWESSINQFQGRYYIGSNMAFRPSTNGKGYVGMVYRYDLPPGGYALDNCARARNTFRTTTVDGVDTTIYDLDIEAVVIGQVIVYAMMGDVRYRPMLHNYIRYRNDLDGPYIRGADLGADTWSGKYGQNLFRYKYILPIAVLDKDKALVRTYESILSIRSTNETVRVTDNIVRSTFQVDPVSGQHVCITKTIEITHRDFSVTVSRQGTTILEELKVEGTVLETLSKTATIEDGPGFTADLYGNKTGWTTDSTTTEHPGTYISAAVIGYGLYDRSGSSVRGYYSGTFPISGRAQAYDGWNVAVLGVYQPTWGNFVAYKSFSASTTGSGGINVMMYDNLDGDDTWILFYKTEAYADEGNYTGHAVAGVYGTYKTSTTTTYKMAYRLKGGVVISKALATSNASGGGKYVLGGYANLSIVTQPDPSMTVNSGDVISSVSCQIGQGLIAYTYNVLDAAGTFKNRVVGLIKIDDATVKEITTTTGSEIGITGGLGNLAAIGISK
jgi:hypothetical protein